MPYVSPTQSTQDPLGRLRITQDALVQWYEDFSTTPDIVNRWLSTSGGGGTAPAWTAGQMNLVSGVTANGYSLFQTRRTFFPRSPAFLEMLNTVNVGNAAIAAGFPANNYALFGFGTTPGTPTIAAPATNGFFFEMSLAGQLSVVTFTAGVRTQLADMTYGVNGGVSAMQIGQDYSPHRYWMRFRGEYGFASLDGVYPEANVVSQFTSGALGPASNILPLTFLLISNGGVSSGLQINANILGDTGRNQFAANNAVATYPSAPTNVVSAAADTAITGVNANRVMLIVSNDSTSKLYLLVDPSGAGVASATNFTYVLAAGATFEFPNPVSTARVRGFWITANGTAGVSDISMGSTGL
jgi:hypothetical protein